MTGARLVVTLSFIGIVALVGGRAWAAPANDMFSGATLIESVPYQMTLGTVGATTEAGEPQPCGLIGATVSYRYIPQVTASLTASSAGSSFDTVLAVWLGRSIERLTLAGCNDDQPASSRTSSLGSTSVRVRGSPTSTRPAPPGPPLTRWTPVLEARSWKGTRPPRVLHHTTIRQSV